MIPNKLEEASVYLRGEELLGVADAQLPDFEYETEAFNPLGVAGEIEPTSPAGLKALTLKLKFRMLTSQAVELLTPESKEVEILGAVSLIEPESKNTLIKQARVFAIVQPKKEGMGKVEAKKTMDPEVELSVFYYLFELDGQKLIEYDPVNWVLFINGKDYLRDVRVAIGK